MQWFKDAWHRRDLPREVVATIGNYDGVHRGQRAILARLRARAAELGLPAVVITFSPHPRTVVDPERAPRNLASREQKRRALEEAGVDAVLEIRFDHSFSRIDAEDFVRDFLHAKLQARRIVVGSRFAFGRGQAGNLELLEAVGRELGFGVEGVREVVHREQAISSSRIRAAVTSGEMDQATAMLGRPFALRGTIVRGDRRGSSLGFPTINLVPAQEVIPARGVYISEVQFAGESERRWAVTNVGVRPTVSDGKDLVVESHILDFARDVYGMEAEITFIERLRDEKRFEGIEALKAQIQLDADRARRYFAARAAET